MSLKRNVSSSLEGTVHGAQAASKAVAPPNKRRGFDSSTFLHLLLENKYDFDLQRNRTHSQMGLCLGYRSRFV